MCRVRYAFLWCTIYAIVGSICFLMSTGMLKSIMKRKDGSNSGENRTAGKKSLQFVGILNGGWVT